MKTWLKSHVYLLRNTIKAHRPYFVSISTFFLFSICSRASAQPILNVIEDNRTSASHICHFELINLSTTPIYGITIGPTYSKNGYEGGLEFQPTNWQSIKGETKGRDLSPSGWAESVGWSGNSTHHNVSWQSNRKDSVLSPNAIMNITLLMDLREKQQCSGLHWTAGTLSNDGTTTSFFQGTTIHK